jgi:hypothetical protein
MMNGRFQSEAAGLFLEGQKRSVNGLSPGL